MVMSPRLQAHLAEYGTVHRSRGNEVCHLFGIPLIIVGGARVLGAVAVATLGPLHVTLAEVAWAATLVFYWRLDHRLALLMGVFLGLLVGLGHLIPFWAGAALLAIGWALQLVGHFTFEKKSPAFMRNLTHLLVGPAWLATRAIQWRPAAPRP